MTGGCSAANGSPSRTPPSIASSAFTLCSIEEVAQALREVYRVLKAGGRFLILEHGLSPEPKVQKWQRRLNGLQMADILLNENVTPEEVAQKGEGSARRASGRAESPVPPPTSPRPRTSFRTDDTGRAGSPPPSHRQT